MSETVHYTGKLVPIYRGDDIENRCRFILQSEEITDLSYCDTWQDRLDDSFYQQYYITDDTIYRVDKKELDSDEEIFYATLNSDCTITFTTKYYNGGCSFNEALDTAIERMED